MVASSESTRGRNTRLIRHTLVCVRGEVPGSPVATLTTACCLTTLVLGRAWQAPSSNTSFLPPRSQRIVGKCLIEQAASGLMWGLSLSTS